MSYNEAIHYLYNLQKHGIKFGLDNITRLLSELNNPHESFLSVHVAGTNGKGSTSAIIASILQAAGLGVGLFTSPHLISFTERIRINGEEIAEDEIIRLAGEIKETVASLDDFSPTFFEVVTAMALLYFKRKRIDIAVVEVGMGGRLDATNIIMPEVSVITNISHDHKEFLGNTLGEIAFEKAGIIKKGVPVVISHQEPEVIEVVRKRAGEKNADSYIYGEDFFSFLKKEEISGISFDYESGNSFQIRDLFLPLTGEHQMQNASVAIRAVQLLTEKLAPRFSYDAYNNLYSLASTSPAPVKGGEKVTVPTLTAKENPADYIEKKVITKPSPPVAEGKGDGDNKLFTSHWLHFIREGLKNIRWPGRLEFIHENPDVVIDGAHNPAAATALSQTLKKLFLGRYKRIVLVLGIMLDKDITGIMRTLLPIASEVILTAPSYDRAASPEKLADVAASLGFSNVHVSSTIEDAIDAATEKGAGLQDAGCKTRKDGSTKIDGRCSDSNSTLIVITGSFYTIGEAKEVLGQKGVLTRLRE